MHPAKLEDKAVFLAFLAAENLETQE